MIIKPFSFFFVTKALDQQSSMNNGSTVTLTRQNIQEPLLQSVLSSSRPDIINLPADSASSPVVAVASNRNHRSGSLIDPLLSNPAAWSDNAVLQERRNHIDSNPNLVRRNSSSSSIGGVGGSLNDLGRPPSRGDAAAAASLNQALPKFPSKTTLLATTAASPRSPGSSPRLAKSPQSAVNSTAALYLPRDRIGNTDPDVHEDIVSKSNQDLKSIKRKLTVPLKGSIRSMAAQEEAPRSKTVTEGAKRARELEIIKKTGKNLSVYGLRGVVDD